jgi:DNA-binding NtrC family response regulator
MTNENRTIMIVDDDKDIVRVIEMGLENAGFEVHAFADPILALQHVERGCKECEVLVSDVRMPNMNAFQLAKRIRQIRPGMKLIMMTAFEVNRKEFQSIFPSTQIDSLITKPVPPSKLVSIVEKMTAGANIHTEHKNGLQVESTRV